MPFYNQEFRSSDLNSPPLSGQTGSGIVVLDACLKNGYNFTVSITGITRSSQTATATVSAADGLKLKSNQILTVGGANQSEYNGTFLITVASATTFTYTVTGTPVTPATGTITAHSRLPITSITRGGTGNLTATATLTNINTSLIAGDKIVVDGAAQSEYNITATLLTVAHTTTTTVVTYLMASDPGASASGTLTYYKAGLQWTHAVAGGTNSQSYVSAATVGALSESYTPRPLQVVDNGATAGGAREMQVWSYESITSDQNGTARWPTTVQSTNGGCCRKSTTVSTTLRAWTLFGDEKTFCFEPIPEATDEQGTSYGFYFGYFLSEKSGDAYNTILCCAGNAAFNTQNWGSAGTVPAHHILVAFSAAPGAATASGWVPRIYNQAGTAVAVAIVGAVASSTGAGIAVSAGGGGMLTYPSPANGALYTQRLWIADAQGSLRGRLLGIHAPMHINPVPQWDVSINNAGLEGVSLRALWINTANNVIGTFMYDMFGPWN